MGTYRFSALSLRAQQELIGGADMIRIILDAASVAVPAGLPPMQGKESASRLRVANHKIEPILELIVDSRVELHKAAALVDRLKERRWLAG